MTGEAGMPMVPDIPAVLSTLLRHHCRFVVVGGIAVAMHGHVRTTRDVDIVPDPGPASLRRLRVALAEMESRPLALLDTSPDGLPVSWSDATLAEGGDRDLATRHGRLDVLMSLMGKVENRDDYLALEARAAWHDVGFGPFPVVGFDDLLDLKTIAGRDQDLSDIRALREARDRMGPGDG